MFYMQKTKTSEQVLVMLIGTIQISLSELSTECVKGNDFAYGEMYAYVECLELIQLWKNADQFGLDVNLEEKYDLN